MYRHEAVEIARKMMELHGVTDELKPWVIDVVLKVANMVVRELSVAPDARTPVAWRRKSSMHYDTPVYIYWMLPTAPDQNDGHQWQPLYAE